MCENEKGIEQPDKIVDIVEKLLSFILDIQKVEDYKY